LDKFNVLTAVKYSKKSSLGNAFNRFIEKSA
jgi:hypothetical protein